MNNKLIGITIGAAVSVMIIALVLTPTLADSIIKGEESTNSNVLGYYSDEAATLTFNTDKTYKINGVAVSASEAWVVSDVGVAYMLVGGNSSASFFSNDGNTYFIRSIKISDGALSYALTASPSTFVTVPCTWAYYTVETGAFGSFNGDLKANVDAHVVTFKQDTTNKIMSVAEFGAAPFASSWNWETHEALKASATDSGFSNDRNVDSWSSSTWTIAAGEQTYTGTNYIGPVKYFENATGFGGSVNNILGIIPLFAILAILVGFVGVIATKRD